MNSKQFASNMATALYADGREAAKPLLRNLYAHDPSLKGMFPNAESYVGYMMAVADGRVQLRDADIASFPVPTVDQMHAARKGPPPDAGAAADAEYRRTYEAHAYLRAEFPTVESYAAYRRWDAQRQARTDERRR